MGSALTVPGRAILDDDGNTGTVVGGSGTILRTTDGGANWVGQLSGTKLVLYGVSFSDVNNGTAVGDSGTILRTTDAGTTWMSQSSGTRNRLTGVCFTDAYTGTVVGGLILRTTNGGTTWAPQSSPASGWLRGVTFTDATTGTAVGDAGTILHTTTGGTTWVEKERHAITPREYVLSQNYPNPFNPTTQIQFTIANRQLTIVKVFDLLGREVRTLLNEVKSPGTYTVEFDGSNLSSGVYVYRLQAGDFVSAKKMLVVK